jgi:hypothetical protein
VVQAREKVGKSVFFSNFFRATDDSPKVNRFLYYANIKFFSLISYRVELKINYFIITNGKFEGAERIIHIFYLFLSIKKHTA